MPRFVLVLNPVTGRTEEAQPVAWSADRESLVRWMLNQRHRDADGRLSYWRDDRFSKAFRRGSPLEWFNPVEEHAFDAQDDRPYARNRYGHGVQEHADVEEYLDQRRREYEGFFAQVPDIGVVHPDEVRVARILMEGEDPA